MGLDLYIFKLSQVDKNLSVCDNFSYCYEEDQDSFVLGKDWLNQTLYSKRNDRILNKERFIEKHNFNPSSCSMSYSNVIEFYVSEEKSLVLSHQEWNDFFDDNWRNAFFYERNEIAYQRKGIFDEGWKILDEIGNCNYSRDIDKISQLVLNGLDPKFLFYLKTDPECCFYAWW